MIDAGPSRTALLVAQGIAFQSTHPRNRRLVPDEAGRLARDFVRAAGLRTPSGDSAWDRLLVATRERLTVPGLSLHYVMRKRKIEELVRSAITDGYSQLLVLGAGLDTLAIRLSRDIKCIEVDHPATQQLKKKVAGDTNVTFVAADFTREAGAFVSGDAIVVAEAVLLYLDEAEVRALLRALRSRHGATRLIFTFWEPRQPINFQNATRLADWWLRKHGEPGRWAIDPNHVRAFLESEGFQLRRLIRDRDYGTSARGEHIAVAEANR